MIFELSILLIIVYEPQVTIHSIHIRLNEKSSHVIPQQIKKKSIHKI